MVLRERNAHNIITHLQKNIQQLEQNVEVLNIKLADSNQQIKQELEKHEQEITGIGSPNLGSAGRMPD